MSLANNANARGDIIEQFVAFVRSGTEGQKEAGASALWLLSAKNHMSRFLSIHAQPFY